jgi:hypothetical protein
MSSESFRQIIAVVLEYCCQTLFLFVLFLSLKGMLESQRPPWEAAHHSPSEDTQPQSNGLSSSSPTHTSFSHTAVVELALELMAKSHHRDVTLQAALLRWHQRTEVVQRHRRRREITAEMFFCHRLQFITFRAWQWELQERQRVAALHQRAVAFYRTWDQKMCWLAWRRHHRSVKMASSAAAILFEKRKWDLVRCNLSRSSPCTKTGRSCCRWHAWVRQGRHALSLRCLTRCTAQHRLTAEFRQWLQFHLFVRRPQRILLDEASSRMASQGSMTSHLHWLLQFHSVRLQCWHRAVNTIGTVIVPAVQGSLRRRLWTRWRQAATQMLLTRRTHVTLVAMTYRKLLAHLVRRRYERHLEKVADSIIARRWLHRWSVELTRKERHDAMMTNAEEHHHSRWSPRAARTVFALWARRCNVRRRRDEHVRECSTMRQRLLAGLAIRRVAEAAVLVTPAPAHHDDVGGAQPTPLHLTSNQSSISSGGGAALFSPSPMIRTTAHFLKPIPLRLSTPTGLSLPGGTTSSHPLPSVHPRRGSSSPTQRQRPSPQHLPPLSEQRHVSPRPPNTDHSVMSAKAVQVQHLLERFHELQRTAEQDKIMFRELNQRREVLQREERAMALPHCHRAAQSSHDKGDQNSQPFHHHSLRDVLAQLHSVRQRIETRSMLRSQIVMLQRDIRHWMERDVDASGGGGVGMQWLDTPRSDTSYR